MFANLGAFLSDLPALVLFETWTAVGVAVLLVLGAMAAGLLAVPARVASPAIRALAGFPLLFLGGGALGILLYLAGGTVRMGLFALLVCSAALVAVALWRGAFWEILRWRTLALLGVLLAVGLVLALFGWGETRDGAIRGMSAAWGDGVLHTLIAEAFLRRVGPDLTMPAFAGEKLREPFGFDFGASMLRSAGFTIGGAFTLPLAGLLACLLGWSGALAVRVIGQASGFTARSAFAMAALLVLSFGGFQWAETAQRVHAWRPAEFFGAHDALWDKSEHLGLIWANHLNTFVSQRHLLLALAFLTVLVVVLLSFLERAGDATGSWPTRGRSTGALPQARSEAEQPHDAGGYGERPQGRGVPSRQDPRVLLVYSIATGLLPLFHTHLFLAAGLLWISALLVSRSRRLFLFAALAALVAAPIVLWQASLFTRAGFLSLAPGWMATGGVFGWLFFWLENLGVFVPLVILAVLHSVRRDRTSMLLLLIPAGALFTIANIVQFQPYRWDNFKLFLAAWLLLLPLVVAEMHRWRFSGASVLRWGLVVLMSLTTLADLATHVRFRAMNPVFTSTDRAIARRFDEEISPDAVVLARTDLLHNHPLALTGRTLLAGYGGWLWTRNYPWEARAALLESLWNAGHADFCEQAKRAGVTHIVDGRFRVQAVAEEC